MAEKLVLVGVLPEIVVIGPDEQVVWLSETANLKVQFDPNRCPFQSNVFQAPPGRQLQSGPPRPGINPGSYKYRLWLNDQPIGTGEVGRPRRRRGRSSKIYSLDFILTACALMYYRCFGPVRP